MTSLTWDAIPSLEAEWAWVPLLDWGGVDTAWHGPLHWTLLKVYNLLLSGWDQSPPWHQGPKEFEGMIQLASTSPGAEVSSKSLLPERAASEAPGAVDLEGISLDGGFVWCYRGKKYWNSSPFVFIQAQSTLFHTHESQLSWLPREPSVGMQKCCCLLNFFCNYSLITSSHRHLSSQGLGFCNDSCPQEMSWWGYWTNTFQAESTFRKPNTRQNKTSSTGQDAQHP